MFNTEQFTAAGKANLDAAVEIGQKAFGGIEKLVLNTDKLEDARLRYRENATLLLNSTKALSISSPLSG